MRVRYRFLGQNGGRYYWESALPLAPGESRHELVSCDVGVFWGDAPVIHGTCSNEARNHQGHMWGRNRFYCDGDVGVPWTAT